MGVKHSSSSTSSSFSNFSFMAGRVDVNESFGDSLLGELIPDDSGVLFFVRDLDNDDEFDIVTSTNPFNGLYLTALLSKQYSTRLK